MPQFLFVIALLFLLASGKGSAATYCVNTAEEFLNALAEASASPEDDEIRINASEIVLAEAPDFSPQGALTIRGGYGSGCGLLSSTSIGSVLRGPGSGTFSLQVRFFDLTLSRLRFTGWGSVRFSDFGFPSESRTGQIFIQRCAFFDNNSGLSVGSSHHDVRVENSLFLDSSGSGGNILNGAGLVLSSTSSPVPVQFVVLNNTVVGNKNGIVINDGFPEGAELILLNTISHDNRSTDLVLHAPAQVRHSLWQSQFVALSGEFLPGSTGNLDVDPQLDAEWRPIEPDSPAINAGDNAPPGGLPANDYIGRQRQIGTAVDLGAFESLVNDSPVFTVINTNNSGFGSLRQAILDANTSPAHKTIAFDINAACPRVIALSSSLPALTAPVTIDGYTQPGSARNSDEAAFDGTLCIALNGGGSLASGLQLAPAAGASVQVEGIAFYGFTSEAVLISGEGRGVLRGNTFGTGATGLVAQGFADAAIRVQDGGGSVIGGNDPAARNVIGRAAQVGLRLEPCSDGSREVRGNLIGLDMDGLSPLANGTGIRVEDCQGDFIFRNVIGFSMLHGIHLADAGGAATNTSISANRIGLTATSQPAHNGGTGVLIEAGEGHVLEANIVAHSGDDGLAVLPAARRVAIFINSFFDNAQQAVDLSPDGVNDIVLNVGAVGANDLLNYPTLIEASGRSSTGRVSGVLESRNGTFRIQLFANESCDASGFGEAQWLIAQTTATITNAGSSSNGSASFTSPVATASLDLIGSHITAIVLDDVNNSSEVSACLLYEEGPQIFEDGFE